MNCKELLSKLRLKTALIVDDAFDKAPKASDISNPDSIWPTFNDDLSPEQKARIAEVYPLSESLNFEDLFRSDGYVAAIWDLREELGDLAKTVFATYISNQTADEEYLDLVQEQVRTVGLECLTSGRDFIEKAREVDVIIIDLFLGQDQNDAALAFSKDALKRAVEGRIARPPLIILMSRSHRLELKRDEFRDDVGLLDSAFRIIKKEELKVDGVLELQLQRLAENFEDTSRLAGFVNALDIGLNDAVQRTLKLLRKLKLSDIGQIQDLLLNAEGEPTGSYLVDVFDRVLQHEIERDGGIIEAAKTLNGFTTINHPPPYVSGSPDLQELVHRLVSQNERRLNLPGSLDSSVTFGDLLRLPLEETTEQMKLLSDLTPSQVLLVLTPVCDLQRGAAPRILLLVGEVQDLEPKNWTYGSDARTPAIRLDGHLRLIKWDLKHVATALSGVVDDKLKSGHLRLAGRLRESHALELQQRVLSGLGRVGQVVALPATFPVELEVYYASADGRPSLLEVPELKDGAVCWVGRDKSGKQLIRLMTTEMVGDGVVRALRGLSKDAIASTAKQAFEHVTMSSDLSRKLAAGVDLKSVTDAKWNLIQSETGGTKLPTMGLISWNKNRVDDPLDRNTLSKAGVILHIKDYKAIGAPGLDEAVRSGAVTLQAAPSGGMDSDAVNATASCASDQ